MKKIALVLALLMVIGMGAFAQVEAFVYAEMDTYVSIDLETEELALTNAPFAMLQFKFGEDVATEAGDGVYGSIAVNNLEGNYRAYATSGDWSDLTYEMHSAKDHWSEMITWDARIVMGPAYLKIDGDETIRARNAVVANVVDDFTLTGMELKGNYVSFSTDASLEAGYSVENVMDIAVEFGVVNGTFDTAGYALDAAVSVTAVPGLGLDANFVTAFGGVLDGSDSGFAVKVGYDVAVAEMTLTPFVAFDGILGTEFGFDIGGGATLGWDSDKGGKVAKSGSNPLSRFFGTTDQWVDAGLTLGGEYSSATEDVNVMLSAAYAPVENLTSIVLVEAGSLLNTAVIGVGTYVDYTVGDIVPHVGFKYTEAATSLDAGVSYSGIDHTKIYANYISDDLANDNGAITIGAVISN